MKQSRRKILGGLFWSYAERIGAQMVSMLVTIVLARLIAPEEYGVISLVTVFISLANTFVSDGFGNALVQKKNADNLDFSSMLFFSLGVSVILFLILFAVSPLVAAYYAMPALTSVMLCGYWDGVCRIWRVGTCGAISDQFGHRYLCTCDHDPLETCLENILCTVKAFGFVRVENPRCCSHDNALFQFAQLDHR